MPSARARKNSCSGERLGRGERFHSSVGGCWRRVMGLFGAVFGASAGFPSTQLPESATAKGIQEKWSGPAKQGERARGASVEVAWFLPVARMVAKVTAVDPLQKLMERGTVVAAGGGGAPWGSLGEYPSGKVRTRNTGCSKGKA